MIGAYAERLACNGLVGIVMTSGPPLVHPYGGVERMLSTNPIAFAAPSDMDYPFCFDAATPISQRGKIEVLGQLQVSDRSEELDVFVSPDIIQPINDDNWFLYHRLKVLQNRSLGGIQVKSAKVEGVDLGIPSLTDLKKKLKEVVKKLDTGTGVTLEEITAQFSTVDEAQIFDAITELLESGEFFEPRVGSYSFAFNS